ncbi:phage holin family protein [soil metagenome]
MSGSTPSGVPPTSATPTKTASTRTPPKRSLVQLITEIPTLVTGLIQRELDLVKAEMIAKAKALGIGAGLIAGAAIILLGMLGVLLTAAILGLSEVMPGWLAALLVAAVLLIIAVILGLIGYRTLKKGIPPVPTTTIDSLQRDFRAIKGIGKRKTS